MEANQMETLLLVFLCADRCAWLTLNTLISFGKTPLSPQVLVYLL